MDLHGRVLRKSSKCKASYHVSDNDMGVTNHNPISYFQDFSTEFGMFLFAIGWLYVVLMVAVVEATSPQGSLLGAVFTLLFYGVLPVSIGLYISGSSARRARQRLQNQTTAAAPATQP
jgi:hypothetical protein